MNAKAIRRQWMTLLGFSADEIREACQCEMDLVEEFKQLEAAVALSDLNRVYEQRDEAIALLKRWMDREPFDDYLRPATTRFIKDVEGKG